MTLSTLLVLICNSSAFEGSVLFVAIILVEPVGFLTPPREPQFALPYPSNSLFSVLYLIKPSCAAGLWDTSPVGIRIAPLDIISRDTAGSLVPIPTFLSNPTLFLTLRVVSVHDVPIMYLSSGNVLLL